MVFKYEWSEWHVNTGVQPVAGNAVVQYVYVHRDPDISEEPTKRLCEASAGELNWRITQFSDVDASDIISYRYRLEIPDEEEFKNLVDASMF